jgi:hypothetical protein
MLVRDKHSSRLGPFASPLLANIREDWKGFQETKTTEYLPLCQQVEKKFCKSDERS